jgi:hypothetical protein
MRLSKLILIVGLWPIVSCMALQDVPTVAEGEDCEADDWCNDGLICLHPNGSSLGMCGKRGTCNTDADCAANQLCQGATYSVRGTCQANTGCSSSAQCSAGLSCFRGACYAICSSSSMCFSEELCVPLSTTGLCPTMEKCPDVCRAF